MVMRAMVMRAMVMAPFAGERNAKAARIWQAATGTAGTQYDARRNAVDVQSTN